MSLGDKFREEEELKKAFDELDGKKTEKQLMLLMDYISMSIKQGEIYSPVKKSELIKNSAASLAQIKGLEKKGILKIFDKVTSRLASYDPEASASDIDLNDAQKAAFTETHEAFENHEVALLHGVTSSGKTEIYIRLIKEALSEGKQVLYLLPEIALTTQIINRLRKYFGDMVGVYHSRYNEHERVEIWNRVNITDDAVQIKKYSVILGARSALFLPFSRLGLIIVDEEHDTSYQTGRPCSQV